MESNRRIFTQVLEGVSPQGSLSVTVGLTRLAQSRQCTHSAHTGPYVIAAPVTLDSLSKTNSFPR